MSHLFSNYNYIVFHLWILCENLQFLIISEDLELMLNVRVHKQLPIFKKNNQCFKN